MLYVHNCLWLNVWYSFSSYFPIFFPIFLKYWTIFQNTSFSIFCEISPFLKNPGRFFQIIHFFFKTPGDFPFFRSSGLRIFSISLYPACNFQNSCIFPKSNFQSSYLSVQWHPVSLTLFSWGSHLLRGATKSSRASSSQHRTLLSPVVLYLVQELLSYVSRPLERLRVGTGIRSGKVDSQRQSDPCTGRAVESAHLHILVPMGRDDPVNGWIFRDHGIAWASRSAWRSIGAAIFDQCQGSGSQRCFSLHDRA